MCFSVEASFGASVVLSAVGVISYKQAESKRLKKLAMIPIFFAIQQFAEGFVWLSHINESFLGIRQLSTNVFIFFAWIIWPLFIPFVLWKLEDKPIRRRVLFILMVLGGFVALVLFYVMIFAGVESYVLDCSLSYEHGLDVESVWFIGIPYVMATIISNFISGLKWMWMIGILNMGSYLFTKVYYKDEHIISVWCFYAAILSLFILFVIKHNKRGKVAV